MRRRHYAFPSLSLWCRHKFERDFLVECEAIINIDASTSGRQNKFSGIRRVTQKAFRAWLLRSTFHTKEKYSIKSRRQNDSRAMIHGKSFRAQLREEFLSVNMRDIEKSQSNSLK